MTFWPALDAPAREDAVADAVLRAASAAQQARQQADRDLLITAVRWAHLHAVASRCEAATWPGTDRELTLGGEGCPLVRESAVVEFAAAASLSADAGRALIADALELSTRLPALWARLTAGDGIAWRARRIAQATQALIPDAAAFVDRQLARGLNRVTAGQLELAVSMAQTLHEPGHQQDLALNAHDERGVWLSDTVTPGGTVSVEAVLDVADALDLDQAVSQGAELLRRLGSDDGLALRRAHALGDLARRQLGLDLTGTKPDGRDVTVPSRPPTQLYVHLHQPAPAPSASETTPDDLPGWPRHDPSPEPNASFQIDNRRRGQVTLDVVTQWCSQPGARVRITPVIDLNEPHAFETDRYAPGDRLAEHVRLRDAQCVFPFCSRQATSHQRLDCDHVTPYASGGPTCACNLASLCRLHHRHKTHHGWRYEAVSPATWRWESPSQRVYLVSPTGTEPLCVDPGDPSPD